MDLWLKPADHLLGAIKQLHNNPSLTFLYFGTKFLDTSIYTLYSYLFIFLHLLYIVHSDSDETRVISYKKCALGLGVFVIIIIKIGTFTKVGFQMDAWNKASCYRGDLFIVSVAKRKHFNEIIMCMHHHGQQMNWSWDFWVWGFVV